MAHGGVVVSGRRRDAAAGRRDRNPLVGRGVVHHEVVHGCEVDRHVLAALPSGAASEDGEIEGVHVGAPLRPHEGAQAPRREHGHLHAAHHGPVLPEHVQAGGHHVAHAVHDGREAHLGEPQVDRGGGTALAAVLLQGALHLEEHLRGRLALHDGGEGVAHVAVPEAVDLLEADPLPLALLPERHLPRHAAAHGVRGELHDHPHLVQAGGGGADGDLLHAHHGRGRRARRALGRGADGAGQRLDEVGVAGKGLLEGVDAPGAVRLGGLQAVAAGQHPLHRSVLGQGEGEVGGGVRLDLRLAQGEEGAEELAGGHVVRGALRAPQRGQLPQIVGERLEDDPPERGGEHPAPRAQHDAREVADEGRHLHRAHVHHGAIAVNNDPGPRHRHLELLAVDARGKECRAVPCARRREGPRGSGAAPVQRPEVEHVHVPEQVRGAALPLELLALGGRRRQGVL
mmetsp:Transcript_9103/g.30161  ORF Transcript_9103/g.30161 Transcript_9103/m.30161 type:complete len:456 (-) Transcript_9103:321-1688(-)